jgi:hypothetical protein
VRFDTERFRCHLTLAVSLCQRGKAANCEKMENYASRLGRMPTYGRDRTDCLSNLFPKGAVSHFILTRLGRFAKFPAASDSPPTADGHLFRSQIPNPVSRMAPGWGFSAGKGVHRP